MANNQPPQTPEEKQPVVKIKRFKIGVNVFIQILLAIFILGMINYLAFNHFKRWDFSRNKLSELSGQTKQILKSLKHPVHMYVFFTSGGEVYKDLQPLLKEYQYEGGKNVIVETVDPFRNLTRAKQLADKYKFGGNENILILDYDGHVKFVNASDMADYDNSAILRGQPPRMKDFKGEQAITSALLQVVEHKPKIVYLITGHGEPKLGDPQMKGFTDYIGRQNVKLKPLNLTDVSSVPDDAKALMMIGPKYDFSNREIKILNAYWEKKGRLFFFLEPNSFTPHLAHFLRASGVTPDNDRVMTAMAVGKLANNKLIAKVIHDVYGFFLPGSKITKNLAGINGLFKGDTQSLTLINPRSVSANGVKVTPLVQATKGYWGVPADEADSNNISFDATKDKPAPLYIAAAVEKGAVTDPHVKVAAARMVVIGNATGMQDAALTQANADFYMNSLNWLLSRGELIGIPPKTVTKFRLNLTENQVEDLSLLAMGVIPGLAALIGICVWWRRRR